MASVFFYSYINLVYNVCTTIRWHTLDIAYEKLDCIAMFIIDKEEYYYACIPCKWLFAAFHQYCVVHYKHLKVKSNISLRSHEVFA